MTGYGPYRGIVDSVHDGDTINIRLDIGFDLTFYARVRVQGINAPELSTPQGKASRDYAQTLLKPGDAVTVTSTGWDKYKGRIDGTVTFRDTVDFATAMVAAGMAVPRTYT